MQATGPEYTSRGSLAFLKPKEKIMTTVTTQKLVSDLKVLVGDAEDLVKATAAQTGDRIAEVRGRMQQAAADIKPRLERAEALLDEKASSAVVCADHYVRSSPWAAVGTATFVGVLLGILLGRR